MRIVEKDLSLKDGRTKAKIGIFTYNDSRDILDLVNLYKSWRKCSELCLELGGSKLVLPESLYLGAFCHFKEVGWLVSCTGNVKRSFDCVDYKTTKDGYNTRIRVKASSVKKDLTTLEPNDIWDEFYFCDFSRLDGTFDVYLIPNEVLYNYKVNSVQTVQDQQRQGRIPRVGLNSLCKANNISPLHTFDFNTITQGE